MKNHACGSRGVLLLFQTLYLLMSNTEKCECDCADPSLMISLAWEGQTASEFTLLCRCTRCGPRDAEGNQRCTVLLHPIAELFMGICDGCRPNQYPKDEPFLLFMPRSALMPLEAQGRGFPHGHEKKISRLGYELHALRSCP